MNGVGVTVRVGIGVTVTGGGTGVTVGTQPIKSVHRHISATLRGFIAPFWLVYHRLKVAVHFLDTRLLLLDDDKSALHILKDALDCV
jgi:hypothetical protein